jgi:O-acetyl-ADP-ribose deacetylase (regulator of RNase III)
VPYSERKGSLFEAEDLDAIAHGVNCKGVMGAGIAKEVRERYPWSFTDYRTMCETRILHPGGVRWSSCEPEPKVDVVHLATQERPGPDAKLRWVAGSVGEMLDIAEIFRTNRIGMPRIGCGIGGLEWVEVRMILELLANESPVELVVFSL